MVLRELASFKPFVFLWKLKRKKSIIWPRSNSWISLIKKRGWGVSSSLVILPPDGSFPASMQTKPLVHSAQAAAVLKVIDLMWLWDWPMQAWGALPASHEECGEFFILSPAVVRKSTDQSRKLDRSLKNGCFLCTVLKDAKGWRSFGKNPPNLFLQSVRCPSVISIYKALLIKVPV